MFSAISCLVFSIKIVILLQMGEYKSFPNARRVYVCVRACVCLKGKRRSITCPCRHREEAKVLLQPINLGMRGHYHPPATLPPGKIGCSLYRKLGGRRGRSGQAR